MITVIVFRAQLERANACKDGLALLDQFMSEQGRKRSVKVLDWTITHQLWLAQAYPSFYAWARDKGLLPQIAMSAADLYGANLSGSDLYGANLRRADLSAADLSAADLRGANLSAADLRDADLRDANLYGANLSAADLRGANLTEAITTNTIGLPTP